MAYQIKLSDGYEVIVTGERCRVMDSNDQQRFAGNHDAVAAWLHARGINGFATAKDTSET